MNLEEKALKFATEAHGSIGQVRKYTGEPYINHPIAVAELVRHTPGCTPEMIAAALLHDTVEDTNVSLEDIYNEFGRVVANYVFWLTDISMPEDGNREARKKLDREHISNAPRPVKTVKIADLIDNTKTISALDPEFWKVYREEKIKLLDVLSDGDEALYNIAREQVLL